MNQTEFKGKIIELLSSLDGLVEECCFNSVSRNQLFILSEIDINPKENSRDPLLVRVAEIEAKKSKEVLNLKEVSSRLFSIYPDLYDINVTVFHSMKQKTFIEFSYVRKSHLDDGHPCRMSNVEPMYHAKLTTPFYLKDQNEKFDVNWQHQEWKNWWRRLQLKMGWTKRNMYGSNSNPES